MFSGIRGLRLSFTRSYQMAIVWKRYEKGIYTPAYLATSAWANEMVVPSLSGRHSRDLACSGKGAEHSLTNQVALLFPIPRFSFTRLHFLSFILSSSSPLCNYLTPPSIGALIGFGALCDPVGFIEAEKVTIFDSTLSVFLSHSLA